MLSSFVVERYWRESSLPTRQNKKNQFVWLKPTHGKDVHDWTNSGQNHSKRIGMNELHFRQQTKKKITHTFCTHIENVLIAKWWHSTVIDEATINYWGGPMLFNLITMEGSGVHEGIDDKCTWEWVHSNESALSLSLSLALL